VENQMDGMVPRIQGDGGVHMLRGLTVVFPQELSGKESEQGSERCTARNPRKCIFL